MCLHFHKWEWQREFYTRPLAVYRLKRMFCTPDSGVILCVLTMHGLARDCCQEPEPKRWRRVKWRYYDTSSNYMKFFTLRTTEQKLGLFILIWMNFECWTQLRQQKWIFLLSYFFLSCKILTINENGMLFYPPTTMICFLTKDRYVFSA